MDIKVYLEERVDDQLTYHAKKASNFKKAHYRLQILIIVLGVIVPVMVNLPLEDWAGLPEGSADPHMKMLVTGLSLFLAIVSALGTFMKYGERWVLHRTTEEKLKKEKYFFLTRSGPYKAGTQKKANTSFVENVERILASEINSFEQLINEQLNRIAETEALEEGMAEGEAEASDADQ